VLHYQNGLVRHEGVFAFSGTAAQVEKHGCLEKTAAVLQAARAAGIPVIYVNIAFRPGFPELKKPTYPLIESIQERNAFLRGSWDAAVPEELEPQPDDVEVINFDSSAFSHTDLDGILRAKGVKHLFLAGIATNWVVESTTRYGAFAVANTLPYYATIAASSDFVSAFAAAAAPA
jgi:nicotinamidase-related amidase